MPGDGCVGVTPIGDDGDAGSLVWGGAYVGGQFASTGAGQFLVRASGGMELNSQPPNHEVELTITPVSTHLDYANIWLKQHGLSNRGILFSAGNGSGANDAEFYIDHYNGSTQYRRRELLNTGVVTIRSNITAVPSGAPRSSRPGRRTDVRRHRRGPLRERPVLLHDACSSRHCRRRGGLPVEAHGVHAGIPAGVRRGWANLWQCR